MAPPANELRPQWLQFSWAWTLELWKIKVWHVVGDGGGRECLNSTGRNKNMNR